MVEGSSSGGDIRSTGIGSTANWNLIVETHVELEDTRTVIKYHAVFDTDQKIKAKKIS